MFVEKFPTLSVVLLLLPLTMCQTLLTVEIGRNGFSILPLVHH